jgi:hypothetical protein
MTVGLAGTFAQSILRILRGTDVTAPAAGVFVKLHVTDPGAAGTGGTASANTTRNAVTFNDATTAGTMSLASLSPWTMTASETIAYISLWTAATGGTFLQSAALTTPVPVISGSTLTINTLGMSYGPIAA